MSGAQADIGVFGGSGFYSLLPDVAEVEVSTPYGSPSDRIAIAKIGGKSVAFLPRHGSRHTIPPHRINYRANVWAMHSLGVRYLISPCAAGSLQASVEPEDFVLCDQYVNRTWGRADTFYDGPEVYHVSSAKPYCPHLRALAAEVIRRRDISLHEKGTMVVVQGPRFSTEAESQDFTARGWRVINMTQYPEAYLALEKNIAVVNISLITDYDAGLVAAGSIAPVTQDEVFSVFKKNAERIKQVVLDLAESIPLDLESPCHHALDHARVIP